MSSRIPGFYRLPPEARLSALEDAMGVDLESFRRDALDIATANTMVENVIGTFGLPNAVAINLLVNGRDVVVPMVVEEPSVVAAVSNMARLTRIAGGIHVEADDSVMTGQVQVICAGDPMVAAERLRAELEQLRVLAHGVHPRLEARGGGLRGMEVRTVLYDEPGQAQETFVVLHFHLDCVDAMGANMVNTIAERLAPTVERITGERVGLRILSNLADKRLARARVVLRPEHMDHGDLNGEEVIQGIAAAYRFAYADPYRAATHNKGIMNGVDAVAIATGNDWRAIEAGAHAWAARDGQYRSLSRWVIEDGALHGSVELPLQVGTVGGPIRVHPTVRSNMRLMGVTRARELGGLMAAVGLAQNLGALRALATEGIQQGHMRMHARSVAATAGATPEQVPVLAARLHDAQDFSVETARRLLSEL
ncbi:MAG: hydroxymethylglutaryl-CoA reductase, degradative [Proteobacteria bacterium]|nr:hydroxymethylglutaryl-CoA reductase, degradative [Pseudomonadota bacterium]MCP4918958.1 hydroxymethylglutaryl-CoA reductase, degradative [Pseudomonadota bacterium]